MFTGKGGILVYRYSSWRETTEVHEESSEYATLETIKTGLGKPLYASAKRVPAAEVVDGFHVPPKARAT